MECLDLGGAHGLHIEIIRFRFPLVTLILFVLNFIHVELCCFARLFYCLSWICGLNVNMVCNVMNCVGFVILLWFMFIVVAHRGSANIVKFISYISYMLYASISTCRGNSVKIFKFHKYVLLVFIQIYKHISRGSSLYSSNLGEFIHINSKIFKKNE